MEGIIWSRAVREVSRGSGFEVTPEGKRRAGQVAQCRKVIPGRGQRHGNRKQPPVAEPAAVRHLDSQAAGAGRERSQL